jgi:dienelactone hydrolase
MRLVVLACVMLALSAVGLAGCGPRPSKAPDSRQASPADAHPPAAHPAPIKFSEFGPERLIQPGILFQEATLRPGSMPMRVWYYQPEQAADKLALVLVPPAGSNLFVGREMGEGSRPEHYPYVRAGFAVASFDIDGAIPDLAKASDAAFLIAARQFRDARAGLVNAKAALDFVLANAPNVDPDRIFIAGHSSAATLALLVAEYEPRIKACAAYAPVADVEARLAEVIPQLDGALPGYREFLHFSSPKTHADKLRCPVFLFHAEDDRNVPISQCTDFAALLKKTNPKVTLVTTDSGDHYDSMIREGVPKGIEWFRHVQEGAR